MEGTSCNGERLGLVCQPGAHFRSDADEFINAVVLYKSPHLSVEVGQSETCLLYI